jgi:glutamate-ammonia-ligase adenylyltransferase
MALKNQITCSPYAADPDFRPDFLTDWPDCSAKVTELLSATAEVSPYLRALMEKEADWLAEALERDPDAVMDQALADVDRSGEEALASTLRRAKRRIALLVALCDLGGVWSLQQVTSALTRFADFAVQVTFRQLVAQDVAAGKLPEEAADDPENCGGIFVLAMGKMGAVELNYSSDIDLIVLFDGSRFQPDDVMTARAQFIKVTRRMTRILSDANSEGYVFRTDLRLRPNPSVTPVCFAADAALRYYESLGRTWERAAFIKARVCAGDIKAGEAFLEEMRPFIWRRHLDFAAVQDAHDMQLKIREHKGLSGPITLPGHDLKLGRGGIREIEFFAQTRQLIAGGRDPELRARGTVQTLHDLAEKGWIEASTADVLTAAYTELRTLEHRVQMINDAQTHHLPTSDSQLQALGRFCMYRDLDAFRTDVRERLEKVHALTESFFAPDTPSEDGESIDLPPRAASIVEQWPTLPALRSKRAMAIFDRLKPIILTKLTEAADPDDAIAEFDRFIRGLPAGVQLFSLFESNPQILDLLAQICTTAPSLSAYLGRNAGVLDAVVSGDFFEPLPPREALVRSLQAAVAREADYEEQLIAARRWQKERHFRIGVLQLRGLAGDAETAESYSDLAGACLEVMISIFQTEFGKKYGVIEGGGVAVLAMGKLGSGEMTPTSDLDLILVYDAAGQTASTGPKELAVTTYYSRFTHGLITALSSPMAGGKLYDVDMRLRPSGRSGPVATSLAAFRDYQENKAWTWEHLALTRAQVVAGSKPVGEKIEEIRKSVICRRRDPKTVAQDVIEMRDRIEKGKKTHSVIWDVKARRGGLLDIELIAQTYCLLGNSAVRKPAEQLSAAAEQGLMGKEDADALAQAHIFFKTFQSGLRLLLEEGKTPDDLGQGGREFLLGSLRVGSLRELQARLDETAEDCAGRIDRLLNGLAQSAA